MAEESTEMETYNDLSKYKVTDLRRMLRTKGLSLSGNKQELIDRLQHLNSGIEEFLESTSTGVEGFDHFDEELEDLDETALMAEGKDENKPTQKVDEEKLEDLVDTSTKKKKVSINRAMASLMPQEETPGTSSVVEEGVKEPANMEEDKEENEGEIVPLVKPQQPKEKIKKAKQQPKVKKEEDSPSKKKILKLKELTPNEKLSLRAEKFGLTDHAKRELRAARFGTTPPPPPTNVQETLQKRAERFGLSPGPSTPKSELEKKLQMRKERFETKVNNTPTEDSKKVLRAKRFKIET